MSDRSVVRRIAFMERVRLRFRLWFGRQRRRLRDAWALPAGPRPYLEDLLDCKDPLPAVDAPRVSVHPAKAHEHGLIRQRGGPVIPALECRILHRNDRLRIITREERSRAVLVHIQAVDFRGPMTGNEGCRENQDSLRTHGALQRSEEHTSELQSPCNLVCRLLLEKKKKKEKTYRHEAH